MGTAPFAGFLNEALRQNDPYLNQWDFGGSLRVRYEIQNGKGIPGVAGSMDFSACTETTWPG